MKTYKIEFELSVDQVWLDDGIDAKTLKRRIKNELPSNLCPYAEESELVLKNIKVNLTK